MNERYSGIWRGVTVAGMNLLEVIKDLEIEFNHYKNFPSANCIDCAALVAWSTHYRLNSKTVIFPCAVLLTRPLIYTYFLLPTIIPPNYFMLAEDT
jgi:hypothetical protein